jgi:hypothetical protein
MWRSSWTLYGGEEVDAGDQIVWLVKKGRFTSMEGIYFHSLTAKEHQIMETLCLSSVECADPT